MAYSSHKSYLKQSDTIRPRGAIDDKLSGKTITNIAIFAGGICLKSSCLSDENGPLKMAKWAFKNDFLAAFSILNEEEQVIKYDFIGTYN